MTLDRKYQLDEYDQKILLMRESLGMPFEKIAVRQRISPAKARQHYVRAVSRRHVILRFHLFSRLIVHDAIGRMSVIARAA
jgi:hypothetical protein